MGRTRFSAATHQAWRMCFDRGWTRPEIDGALRSRVTYALRSWQRWYDWGGSVMWLVGRNDSGSAGSPRGRDMWWIPTEYVEGIAASLVADFEVRYGCYITTRYEDVRKTGADIEWRIFDLQDDGRNVLIGIWPNEPGHGGRVQPLPTWHLLNHQREMRLLLWWYLVQHKGKAQWFGLRSWAYWKALHASVNDKVPFSCQVVPDRATGGYDHWHCQLRKRHDGPHRYRNYVWPGANGRTQHAPAEGVAQ